MSFKQKAGVQAVRLALGVLAGSALIATGARAQSADANAAPDAAHRVVVTGSNIPRIDREGPTAVETITRSAIEKTGASTVVELLGKLPSVGVSLDGTDSASYATGATSAGLRNLDPKYTLVLLNGRRLANYGFADGAENSFVDLNSIPLSAIDSVEILRDGASAIYGSDAVAGVINFITKRNYQGTEVAGNFGANQKGDGGVLNASLSTGWGDLDKDGHNLLLTIDAYRKRPLISDKHAGTNNPDYRRFGGTDNRTEEEFQGFVRDFEYGEPGFVIPGCKGTVGYTTTSTPDQVCFTNPSFQLSPSIKRVGISGIFTQRLSGTAELFAEVGFNHNSSRSDNGFPRFDQNFLGATNGTTNPGVLALPGEVDDASGNVVTYGFFPGDRLQIFHSITEAGRQIDTVTSDSQRLVTGWRGPIGKWDSEGAITYNRNHLSDFGTNALLLDVSNASLQAGLLGNVGYDPFNPANPASVVNPMFTTTERIAVSKLETADWKMSNPEAFSLMSRPVGFAWGAQVQHESVDDRPDAQVVAGNIVNNGATASNAGRSVVSMYGEFSVPLAKSVEMQLALRGDHYNDFGTSYNPKLAVSWKPIEQLMLRGSATTSFKAPTLPEIGSTTAGYNTVADWARCGPLGYVGADCAYNIRQYSTGNPNLKAETARNYSLGMVLQPTKDLSILLDWYGIMQKNTVQALDPQYILDNEDIIPGYAALVLRDPRNPALERLHPGLDKGRINGVISPFFNVGQTNTHGLDLDASYKFSMGSYGKLNFRDVDSYTLSFEQAIAPGLVPTSRLDGTNHPRWNNSFRAGYEIADKEFSVTARTYASTLNITDPTYQQAAAVTNMRIPSYTTWDLNLNMKPSKQMTVNVGINNAFDKKIVFANSAYIDTYVQPLNDLVGRYFYINARYAFK